jgi:pyridoxal biosynthesis lyase PdxS
MFSLTSKEFRLKVGLAEMLKGGVVIGMMDRLNDVVTRLKG